jgi:hypothetical protein
LNDRNYFANRQRQQRTLGQKSLYWDNSKRETNTKTIIKRGIAP